MNLLHSYNNDLAQKECSAWTNVELSVWETIELSCFVKWFVSGAAVDQMSHLIYLLHVCSKYL